MAEEIRIKEDYIKLDSAIKLSGIVGTGGQAKMIIQNGQMKVNGEICTQRGKKLRNGDSFQFENKTFIIKNGS